jgi:hypothetical protein
MAWVVGLRLSSNGIDRIMNLSGSVQYAISVSGDNLECQICMEFLWYSKLGSYSWSGYLVWEWAAGYEMEFVLWVDRRHSLGILLE